MSETLGAYLRWVREELGYSTRKVEMKTEQFPERERVSKSYLSQLERGIGGRPSPEKLLGLAKIYGLSYEDLLGRAGYPGGKPIKEEAPAKPLLTIDIFSPKMQLVLKKMAELHMPPEDQDMIANSVTPMIEREERVMRERRERRKRGKERG